MILSLAIHSHQPVGNFPQVFEAAYRQSYLPMLEALTRHPSICVALHYSGPLLDWLEEAHPEFLLRLHGLVARGQVELMTGGYYEPILPIIPDRDKRGQIQKMTAYLRRRFGVQARGLWLTERVWEPHLAKSLAQAGVEYTIVDDAHFFAVGLREEDLVGYFVTEEEGSLLKVFPSRKRLRYLIPWRSPAEVVAYLRGVAHQTVQGRGAGPAPPLLLMGDDGEKFGLWPGTYAHCWERGWVEEFFRALEAEVDWLTVMAPGEAAKRPAAGPVYLPTAAYEEMMEWALPAARSAEFAAIHHRLRAANDPAVDFLRGGFWRHFLVKYPEINTMHKKMLRVSEKVDAMPAGRRRRQAQDHLWSGQCNCPYWHGVFGGVYLPHIRKANFAHLIAAESLADVSRGHAEKGRRGSAARAIVGDLDGDAADEIELSSAGMVLTIDPTDGGSVVEWDWRFQRINLTNVLTRRPEAYHQQLQAAAVRPEVSAGAVETIHTTRVRVKEPGLERLLIYDWYRRASFLDHVLSPHVTPGEFPQNRYAELGDFVGQPYALNLIRQRGSPAVALARDGGIWFGDERLPLRVEKQMILDAEGSRLDVVYRVADLADRPMSFLFGVETNWAITDPDAVMVLDSQQCGARSVSAAGGVRRVELQDTGWSGKVALEIPSATVWLCPLETVSNSEAGFERILQGVTCLCLWPITLERGEAWEATIRVTFQN